MDLNLGGLNPILHELLTRDTKIILNKKQAKFITEKWTNAYFNLSVNILSILAMLLTSTS